jgi:hypothetical protein
MTIAMGDVAAAVADAEKICPTESHKYGYLISFAQMLEIELYKRGEQLIECQHQLIQRNYELLAARSAIK